MTDLICPKCQATMRSYERSGFTVDQCTTCQGIFLDRGELERLLDAEGRYVAPASATPPAGYTQPGYPGGQGGFIGSLFGDKHGGARRGHH